MIQLLGKPFVKVRVRFVCASVNPVIVKWRCLVLRASISSYRNPFFTCQHKTYPIKKTCKIKTRICLIFCHQHFFISPSYLQVLFPKFSLLTYNHLHTLHHYTRHSSSGGDVSVCFKSDAHQRVKTFLCRLVGGSVVSFFIHLLKSHYGKSTLFCPGRPP